VSVRLQFAKSFSARLPTPAEARPSEDPKATGEVRALDVPIGRFSENFNHWEARIALTKEISAEKGTSFM